MHGSRQKRLALSDRGLTPHGAPSSTLAVRGLAPEVTVRERVAGAGLEVALEVLSELPSFKRDVQSQLPWAVSGGGAILTCVVLCEAPSDICRLADVASAGSLGTLQDVRVVHVLILWRHVGRRSLRSTRRVRSRPSFARLRRASEGTLHSALRARRRVVEAAGKVSRRQSLLGCVAGTRCPRPAGVDLTTTRPSLHARRRSGEGGSRVRAAPSRDDSPLSGGPAPVRDHATAWPSIAS